MSRKVVRHSIPQKFIRKYTIITCPLKLERFLFRIENRTESTQLHLRLLKAIINGNIFLIN
jgi:hypothetical protein